MRLAVLLAIVFSSCSTTTVARWKKCPSVSPLAGEARRLAFVHAVGTVWGAEVAAAAEKATAHAEVHCLGRLPEGAAGAARTPHVVDLPIGAVLGKSALEHEWWHQTRRELGVGVDARHASPTWAVVDAMSVCFWHGHKWVDGECSD